VQPRWPSKTRAKGAAERGGEAGQGRRGSAGGGRLGAARRCESSGGPRRQGEEERAEKKKREREQLTLTKFSHPPNRTD
jgi:hypothetical protein